MNNKKNILILLPFLVACGGNNSSFNSEVSSSSESSSLVELSQIELVEKLKEEFLTMDDMVSSYSYSIDQEDYYGISIYTSESGTKSLYLDDFVVTEFTQKIGKDRILGRKEYGLSEPTAMGSKIYEILYFGEGDEANKVTYYANNDYNKSYFFDLSFANEYVNNILNVTLSYFSEGEAGLHLETNFAEIDLMSDGEKTLQYKFVSYSPDGKTKIEEVEREDIIIIENHRIISCLTDMKYSLHDGVNYQRMEKSINYEYEDLISYSGEKLDYRQFE